MSEIDENNGLQDVPQSSETNSEVSPIGGMYKEYFIDYASYVILERAVPGIDDGLKPVQRRILHSMHELEDGRYNKVANVVGNTMKYHPHGDASINDALVQLGQKDLLIDMQGNWGNILTGDGAAAGRYIEARLSKFALDTVFNNKTTPWTPSYDGRNKEPISHPVKFPLLLAQGVEGIAVGLACKIMPHNFVELIDASIDILKGKSTNILPDFITGGLADFSKYNNGLRGGKIRVRAKITILDNKTLAVTEIPFSTTTGSVMDSIVSANEKGKIRIKKVEDNTAEFVEIIIHLAAGISPDKTIEALYAFTDCEISISPNSCVIVNDHPVFMGVNDILLHNTMRTKELLRQELEIEKSELQESLLFASLEKIFIENRIYRDIEEAETWEKVLETIDRGLDPYKPQFYREITQNDIIRLTEIRIKRISKFDSFKNEEYMRKLNEQLEKVIGHLNSLVEYTIAYYKEIKKKYGKGRERKTEIASFEAVEVTAVVVRNEKLMWDKEQGMAGYGLKQGEFVTECADIDDIIVFREDGSMMVTKVSEKAFIGKNATHIQLWMRENQNTVYHMIYRDGKAGAYMIKRFRVKGITRDKEYDLTKGTPGSHVVYFTINPQGESEILTIYLKPRPRLKKQIFDFDLGELAIKGRDAQGNILSKFPVRKIIRKAIGESTLESKSLWFDENTRRINSEERGNYLGDFRPGDYAFVLQNSGTYRVVLPESTVYFEDVPAYIAPYEEGSILTIIYKDEDKGDYYVKRVQPDTKDKIISLLPENENVSLVSYSFDPNPEIEVKYLFGKQKEEKVEMLDVHALFAVKTDNSKGNKININNIEELTLFESESAQEESEDEQSDDTLEIDIQDDDNQITLDL